MASNQFTVWVLEIAVLKARASDNPSTADIAQWEVWKSFNTRGEAVDCRENAIGIFRGQRKFWRIRKYVPAKEQP